MRRFLAVTARFRRNSDGAAAVEFALVSMCFITILCFIYMAGLYFITYNCLQYGTEDAARYASLHEDSTDDDLRGIVQDKFAMIPINPEELDIVITEETSEHGVSFRQVQSTYRLQIDVPFMPAAVTGITFVSTSKMAIY